jgi:hypothetical protein
MKNDNVASISLTIMRFERGKVLIREPSLLERFGTARHPAEIGKRFGGVSTALTPHSLLKRRVRSEQVHVLKRRRLI